MYTTRLLCFALLWTGALQAGEKKIMHCFAWTPVKDATPADWTAFYKASDELPKKIKGLTKVWFGKLETPFSWTGVAKIDPEVRKKLMAGETVTADISRTTRDYG